MEKEWTSWMKFNAVEILTPAQIPSLPGDVRIIGTRWVRTDKNQKQRLLALHQKTAKSREQVTKEYPFAAKSRLVAQGHQEDASDLRTDSPTASLLAFNLVSAVAVLQSWEVLAAEASTAGHHLLDLARTTFSEPKVPFMGPKTQAVPGGRSCTRHPARTGGACPPSSLRSSSLLMGPACLEVSSRTSTTSTAVEKVKLTTKASGSLDLPRLLRRRNF